MLQYERILSKRNRRAVELAEKVISEGWTLGGYPKVRLNLPQWELDSGKDRSWNFHIHCWDMLDPVLVAFDEIGRQDFLRAAVGTALDWAGRYPLQEAAGTSMAWYDMAVGVRAYRLAYIIDAADRANIFVKEEREVLWSSLLEHQNFLADDENIAFHNNHGYFQAAGQIAMGRRFVGLSDVMEVAYRQGKERLYRMLTQQFFEDGMHKEHSPDYHRMVYETLVSLIFSGLVDDEATIEFSKKIELSLSWFVLPNQHIANFGDTDFRLLQVGPAEAQRKWQTAQMQHLVSGGSIGNLPQDRLAVFEAAGFYVVRQGNSYLAQIAAFHSRTHKHADDLSFIWTDKGCDLLVDAGRYGYLEKTEQGSDLWLDGHWYANPNRVFCESTRAHNTLEFDGKNYLRRGVRPYGSAIKRWVEDPCGLYALETECKHFGSIRHARVLIFMPGRWLIVFDWFHDNQSAEHQVRQWFHLGPSLKLEKQGTGYQASLPSGESLTVAPLLGEVNASEPYLGEEGPPMQGWWSPKEREMIPNYAFCFEQSGVPSGVFASLFVFSKTLAPNTSRSRANGSGRKAQFVWVDDSGTHTVRLERPKDGSMEVFYEQK